MCTIFTVEDDVNIRELVVYALTSANFDAVGFETADGLFAELLVRTPDLLLLDIMLPDVDGISILKQLRENKKTADTPVIMLTAKSSEFDKIKGLDLGADDYITKPFSVLELISRIKAVLRRADNKKEPVRDTLSVGDIVLNIEKHTVTVGSQGVTLTLKEFELLHHLVLNEGIVLSREKLMDKVWGFDFEGESRTVDMHIKTLRQKLLDCGSLIKTVRGIGYKIDIEG